MGETLQLLKIGGRLLGQPDTLHSLLRQFLAFEGRHLLVHGGGQRASALGRKLGSPARLVDGRRITDAPTLEIVTMVYAGLYNKQLVARLQAFGCNALGLTGADGNTILARKRPVGDIDYGFAGDIDRTDAPGIRTLLLNGYTPVFCAITHDGRGQLLNTNADTIAAELARGLAAHFSVKLYFCLDKNGVLADAGDDASVIPQLSQPEYDRLKASGSIHSGMIPKLDNAFLAQAAGAQVTICGPASFANQTGTQLSL